MHRISSSWTAFTKWVFPIFWFGFLLILIGSIVFDGTLDRDPWILLGPLAVLVFGAVMFRLFLWNLADAVYDHDTYLVARRRGIEARIALENIMNVNASGLSNPKRVTLRLLEPSALGGEIAFIPKAAFTFNPFAKIAVAESLMERAFAARTRRAA